MVLEMELFAIPLVLILWSGYAHSLEQHLVVIDTDPGIDDAMAILTILGDPSVTVEAITCARGNAELDQVVINLYKTLAVAGKLEIPVYKGNNYGILTSPSSDNYFGKDGFGELGNELAFDPEWTSKVQTEHAASFLARIVKEKQGQITIVALAPLTNLALALELNPLFLKQARKVVILGGTIRGMGNVRPGIEFNFYADPEAAAVVLDRAESSNTPVTLVPMETVEDCELGMGWRLNELAKIRNKAMSFLDKLDAAHRKMHPLDAQKYTPYDTYAVVALVNPMSVANYRKFYGSVETSGLKTRGVLIVDYLNLLKKTPNIDIVMAMNKGEIRKTITQDLSRYSRRQINSATTDPGKKLAEENVIEFILSTNNSRSTRKQYVNWPHTRIAPNQK